VSYWRHLVTDSRQQKPFRCNEIAPANQPSGPELARRRRNFPGRVALGEQGGMPMTGTLRIHRVAPLALLALAVAASVASVRLGATVAPSFPLLNRLDTPTEPDGAAPGQVPTQEIQSPATDPVRAPVLNSAPLLVTGDSPNSPAAGDSMVSGSDIGSPSTVISPAGPGTTKISPVAPSRFADGEPTLGPAPLRVAPAQTSPKQPRPGTGN
jgi:hypothetical protein